MDRDPRLRFDNLVVGAGNRVAAAAAQAVAERPGAVHNPLFIHGQTGLGKTHVLCAVGQLAAARHPQLAIEYLALYELVGQLLATASDVPSDEYWRPYERAGVLLVDDVQFLAGRRQLQGELRRLFDRLLASGGQLVAGERRPAGGDPGPGRAAPRAHLERTGRRGLGSVGGRVAGAAGRRTDRRVRGLPLRGHDRRGGAGGVVAGEVARGDRILERPGLPHRGAGARADVESRPRRRRPARDVQRGRRAPARPRAQHHRGRSGAPRRSGLPRSRTDGGGRGSRRAGAGPRGAAGRTGRGVHARRIRDGNVEPARGARGRRGDRVSGRQVQPAADPRRERRGEDAPAERHRQRLASRGRRANRRRVRPRAAVHRRDERGRPGRHHRALARAVSRRGRAADRRRAVRRRDGARAGRVLPVVQRSRRCGEAGGAHERPAARRDPRSRGAAERAVRGRARRPHPGARPCPAREALRAIPRRGGERGRRAAARVAGATAGAERARHRVVREPPHRGGRAPPALRSTRISCDASSARPRRTPARRAVARAARGRDPVFLDAEKVVWDWPDVGARVIEEFR